MLRRLGLLLVPALALIGAAPAQAAHSFVLTRAGSMPAVAVDGGGIGHFVWDERAPDGGSVTHYCKVVRGGRGCAAGSERTFRPTQASDQANNTDFPGPRVVVGPGARVVVLTYRCCAIDGPDFHSSVLFRYLSGDAGNTFDGGSIIGTTEMTDVAPGPGDAVTTIGTGASFTSVQTAPMAGFNETEAQLAPGVIAVDKTVALAGAQPVVAIGDGRTFALGVANGDPNATPSWAFGPAQHGSELQLAASPSKTFLFEKSGKSYVLRRVDLAGRKLGRSLHLTSSHDFPIFGTASADASGRIHSAWQGRGLRYRRTNRAGSKLERVRTLVGGRGSFFNLAVSAGSNGRGWVAWDSNGSNKTVRAIATR
jgi:hypothetical protein